MNRRVVWAPSARDDLRAIHDFIRKDSPLAAQSTVTALLRATKSLIDFPEKGRRVPELADVAIRELIVGNHRVLYTLAESAVHIAAIVHGARDLPSLWKGEAEARSSKDDKK